MDIFHGWENWTIFLLMVGFWIIVAYALVFDSWKEGSKT